MAAASQARVVMMTTGSADEANRIARALVDERLAACVNVVGPIRSIYRWRGAVEDESEYLLLAKTRARLYPRLERRVKELHSYEVPEVLALAPAAGSAHYLEWLMESTTEGSKPAVARSAVRGRAKPRG
jgi:periplasmic divalent cation tolerance protein